MSMFTLWAELFTVRPPCFRPTGAGDRRHNSVFCHRSLFATSSCLEMFFKVGTCGQNMKLDECISMWSGRNTDLGFSSQSYISLNHLPSACKLQANHKHTVHRIEDFKCFMHAKWVSLRINRGQVQWPWIERSNNGEGDETGRVN